MHHNFNIKVAEKYGMACAVILENIFYWVKKNEANNINFYKDTYWTYNSTSAFKKIFTYLSERQIRSALDKLEEEGLILVDNFNKGCDRTLWYAITAKGIRVLSTTEDVFDETSYANEHSFELEQQPNLQKCQMDTAKMSNGNDKNATSMLQKCQMDMTKVQDNTNNKPYINTNNKLTTEEREIHKEKENPLCVSIVNHWNNQGLMLCEFLTQDLVKTISFQLKTYSCEQICEYISRYAEILQNKEYYFSNSWGLRSFLTKPNAMRDFTDTGEKWLAYQRWKANQTNNSKNKIGDIYELYLDELEKENNYATN